MLNKKKTGEKMRLENFFTILAWIMIVPTTLFVGWCLFIIVVYLFVAIFTKEKATLTIGPGSFFPILAAAMCWAWLLR